MTTDSGNSGDVLYIEARDRTQRIVSELLKDSGLRIREHTYELVITNSKDPEWGQIHIAYDGGYVSWERVVWTYWGPFKNLGDGTDAEVTPDKIISALTGSEVNAYHY
jgi:hypothetical protein